MTSHNGMRAFAAAAEEIKRKRKETAKVMSCESEGDEVIMIK